MGGGGERLERDREGVRRGGEQIAVPSTTFQLKSRAMPVENASQNPRQFTAEDK